MKKFAFLFTILALGAFLMGCSAGNTETTSEDFSVTIKDFDYSPGTLSVVEGTTVTINIKNDDPVRHGIFLDTYGIQEFVNPGETKTIQFTAMKGSSAVVCSTDHGEKLNIQVL